MKDNVHKYLNDIIVNEAGKLSPNGLSFSGFSLPQEKSNLHQCFKAWSQHFSFEDEAHKILDNKISPLSEINFSLLSKIYLNKYDHSKPSDQIDYLIHNNLVKSSDNNYRLTDKGILVLSNFLNLRRVLDMKI